MDIVYDQKLAELNSNEQSLVIDKDIMICKSNEMAKCKTKILYRAQKDDFLKNYRMILKKCNYICDLEYMEKYDYFNQARSGLNETIIKDFKQFGVEIVIDFKKFKKNIARTMIRINQNINLARKFGVKIHICSLAENEFELINKKDLKLLEV